MSDTRGAGVLQEQAVPAPEAVADDRSSAVRRRVRVAWWAVVLTLTAVLGVNVVQRVVPVVRDSTVGSPRESTRPPAYGDLPGRAVPVLDSPHIPVGKAAGVRYDSVPPTSGPHFAVPPAPGVYDRPLPDGLQVHALEHGRVGIQYAPGTPATVVARLRAVGARFPDDVFVAPYPGLAHGIALTAWGRIDTFDGYDEHRVERFVEALRGRYDHGWQRWPGSGSAG